LPNNRINFNGNLINPESQIFSSQSRGVAYGDGLFETIRMTDGSIPFLSLHFNRLVKGMNYLGFLLPENFTLAYIETEIRKIAEGNSRIRITLTRAFGGKYTPSNNTFSFLIESESLSHSKFLLNNEGKRLTIYSKERLTCSSLSNLKTCNALLYILGSQYAQNNGYDDALMINEYSNVSESTHSNLFLVKNGTVTTPPLTEGCIEGVTRKVLLEVLLEKGLPVLETPIKSDELVDVDEIWLTNSIQGLQWVAAVQDSKQYSNALARHAIKWLNQRFTIK